MSIAKIALLLGNIKQKRVKNQERKEIKNQISNIKNKPKPIIYHRLDSQ
jgi:hypothetical protein